MMITTAQVMKSAGVYPITTLYFGAVAVTLSVAHFEFSPWIGITILGFLALILAFYATWRELREVYKLVHERTEELIARIEELSILLHDSGIVIPVSNDAEQKARAEIRRKRGPLERRQ